jgi:hypothetical protein
VWFYGDEGAVAPGWEVLAMKLMVLALLALAILALGYFGVGLFVAMVSCRVSRWPVTRSPGCRDTVRMTACS